MLRSSNSLRFAALAWLLSASLAVAQTPGPPPQATSLPPSGAAGGDLSGTYPNPTVISGSHITNASIANSGLATPAPCSAFGTTAGTCLQGAGNAGIPSAIVLTNASGVAPSLTAGNVTTNANLTGPVTSVGNVTTIVGTTGKTAWTPTDGSGASLSFTVGYAFYYQMNGMVFAQASITFPVTVSGASVAISGVPIGRAAGVTNIASIVFSGSGVTYVAYMSGVGTVNMLATGTVATGITNAVVSNQTLVFNVSYPVL